MSRKQPEANISLLRAKRLFVGNLVLFALLLAVAWILFGGRGSHGVTQQAPAPEAGPEKPLSLPEQAYMRGQIDALSESPEIRPPLQETWIRRIGREAIRLDPAFEDQSEASVELLLEEYYRGYAERFDDHFDPSIARKSGFDYGLRFDPALHPFPDFEWIKTALSPHKAALSARFELDALKWHLFVKAFDQGFEEGYYRTREGVTADARAPIPLDPDDFF